MPLFKPPVRLTRECYPCRFTLIIVAVVGFSHNYAVTDDKLAYRCALHLLPVTIPLTKTHPYVLCLRSGSISYPYDFVFQRTHRVCPKVKQRWRVNDYFDWPGVFYHPCLKTFSWLSGYPNITKAGCP